MKNKYMIITLKITALLFVAALASACAVTPQTVAVELTLEIAPSDVGQGHSLTVYVVDERATTDIGHRGLGLKGAAITSSNDMVAVFRDAIVENMSKLGFAARAVPSLDAIDDGMTVLRVDIRAIEYETSIGFWTGGINVRGLVKATATRRGNTYEQLYRVDDEKRVVFVPFANSNAQMINTAVSALLQEVFDDRALIQFVTG